MIVEFRPRPVVAVLAVAGALVISGVLAALSGAPPLDAYSELLGGALGSPYAVGVTLARAVPLILVALSFIVGVRAGELNIGIEGQLYVGALTATAVGASTSLPGVLHLPLAIVAGAAGGAAWVLIPAALKLWRNVSEIVSGLLLNYVAIFFTSFMLAGPMRDPGQTYAESYPIQVSGQFPVVDGAASISTAFLLVLAIAAALWFVLRSTVFGFELRTLGANRRAAALVGVRSGRVAFLSFLLSGALGGLAGALEILGNEHRFIENFSPGWGYTGIIVALLGGVSPIGAVVAGVGFAILESGTAEVQRVFGIPAALSLVIEGAAVLFYLAAAYVKLDLRSPLRAVRGQLATARGAGDDG